MRTVAVLQNTDAEHLGLIEDHLEGRNIRFRYIRPSHDSDWQKHIELRKDGLIVLGAAPWGTVSEPRLPLLDARVQAIRSSLEAGIPTVAISTGTQLLALAAGHPVTTAELCFRIDTAHRINAEPLNGFVPQTFPAVTYMRDFPGLPDDAKIICETADGTPVLYQPMDNCLCFIGHPGIKSAIIEDSVLQANAPLSDAGELFSRLRAMQSELSEALVTLMTGVIQFTGWMQAEPEQ